MKGHHSFIKVAPCWKIKQKVGGFKFLLATPTASCEIRKKITVNEHVFVKYDPSFIIIITLEFFGGQLDIWSGFFYARAVFSIVVERVDIVIAINFYLHYNLTVQLARLGDSRPYH